RAYRFLALVAGAAGECNSVIQKQQAILIAVVAVVPKAVAGIEQTAVRQSDGNTRCEIAEAVFAAEPVRNKADFSLNGLLVAEDGSALGTRERALCGNDPISSSGNSRPVIACDFLAEISVNQPVAIDTGSVVHRRIPDQSCRSAQTLHVFMQEFIL